MTPESQDSKPRRVALYVRVSTRDKGQDVANQLDKLREFCHANEWRIVREFQDQDSGGKSDRQGFVAMLAAARVREFDIVLFWALDRFSREGVLETLQYLQLLASYGVDWKSFTEQYLDSCGIFRDAVLSILATIAKQERVRLSERVRAGLDRVRTKGSRRGRPVGRPRIVFDRQEVVRLRQEEKLSWSQIARQMKISSGSVRRACLATGEQR